MDPALKQRLLGAAVLVALAVIFLPMLLDGPAPPSGEAMRVEIPPPPDRRFETRVLPLDAAQPPASAASSRGVAPPPADEPVVLHEVEVAPRIDAVSGEDTSGSAESAAAAAAPRTTPAPIQPEADTPPASSAATPVAPAARLPAASASGRFVVTMGSFGQRRNADALVSQLGGLGIAATVEPVAVDGRTLMRVRAGPYRSRTEADQVRLGAQRAVSGLQPLVVELEQPGEAPAGDGDGSRAAGWAVQVGVFNQEENARSVRDRLRQGGISSWIDRIDGESGPSWRVRAGPEAERASADRLKDTLKSRFQLDGLVVSHP